MSSFFEKLHGKPASTVLTTTNVRQAQPPARTKAIPERFSYAAIAQQKPQPARVATDKSRHIQTKSLERNGVRESGNGTHGSNKSVATIQQMRRTYNSSSELPTVSKKRKISSLKPLKNLAVRDVSRLSASSGEDAKLRRTASPVSRIHRSPSDDETDFSEPIKLFRGETPDVNHNPPVERHMLNPRAGEDVNFRHAKELVCVVDKDSFVPEDPEKPDLEVTVKLPYGEEIFKLLRPKKHDEYHPIGDIVDTVNHLLTYFLPADVLSSDTSIQDYIYRLSKAIKSPNAAHTLPVLDPINDAIVSKRPFNEIISKMTHMPRDLLQRICMQCYTRQVSPHLDGLRKYTAFSSTVYGELLFPFLSKLFADMNLRPDTTFVDLGCGVGNCIIQAAGETGCAAIGIEIMDHAANLATAQVAEFESRMRAWGLSHGPITFIHGDILTLPSVSEIIQRADVVLCNNYAFTAELNDALLRLFLDLKEGSRVISLKSFVPVGKDGRHRGGRGGVGEMLKVEKGWFGAGSVSWMPGGGEYFVSTVNRSESRFGTPISAGDV